MPCRSRRKMCIRDSSYTEGLSPAVMEYVLKTTLCPKVGGHTSCDEIGLPVTATGDVYKRQVVY